MNKDGELLEEKRVPTCSLTKYLSSINGRKHVAIEAVGFVYPIYDKLKILMIAQYPLLLPPGSLQNPS